MLIFFCNYVAVSSCGIDCKLAYGAIETIFSFSVTYILLHSEKQQIFELTTSYTRISVTQFCSLNCIPKVFVHFYVLSVVQTIYEG
jgi:hypothetical protein